MRQIYILLLSIGGAFFIISKANAQVPNIFNYQGRIAVQGVNFDGTGQFKFALVNDGGTITFWSNDGTSIAGAQPAAAVSLTVTNGIYSVRLGDSTHLNMIAIPSSVFNNYDVRLRVWFNDGSNGSQLLSPDQRLAATGYAMIAREAIAAGLNPASEARIRTLEDNFLLYRINDFAYRGQSRPFIPTNTIWEAFTTAAGMNSRLTQATSGSFAGNNYAAMGITIENLPIVTLNSNGDLRLFKTITVNAKVLRVEANFSSPSNVYGKFTFKYTDNTSDSILIDQTAGVWSRDNPQPGKTVLSIEIYAGSNSFNVPVTVKDAKVVTPNPASFTVTLLPQVSNWRSFRVSVLGAREAGDELSFAITNESNALTNLPFDTLHTWTGDSPPNSITIYLKPNEKPSIGGTNINTLGVFYTH